MNNNLCFVNVYIDEIELINDFTINIRFIDGQIGQINLKENCYKDINNPITTPYAFAGFQFNQYAMYWDSGTIFTAFHLYDLLLNQQKKIKYKQLKNIIYYIIGFILLFVTLIICI